MEAEGLKSEYPSYQIEMGRFKRAIETLERGRALLLSEMQGLHTSTDQLRAADPAPAERFAAVNRSWDGRIRPSSPDERVSLILSPTSNPFRAWGISYSHCRLTPQFCCNTRSSSSININQSRWRSNIVILYKDLPPSVFFTPPNFHDRANQLTKGSIVAHSKGKGTRFKGLRFHSSFCPRRTRHLPSVLFPSMRWAQFHPTIATGFTLWTFTFVRIPRRSLPSSNPTNLAHSPKRCTSLNFFL
ncbi:hypothetical protein EDB85DRAFT_1980366 [Lactarius pseudohatsudake]|nr:hypothetical protein EDB85DRAFT_1980366 [Lactarius pseudohatsudake]